MKKKTADNQTDTIEAVVADMFAYLGSLREEGVAEVELFSMAGKAADAGKSAGNSQGQEALRQIAEEAAACQKCSLYSSRRCSVPGQGCLTPEILFVGEAPGEDEDRQGVAFVGRAGQLLTRLINKMGYARDEVFIANILKCRPPDNRRPLPEEMEACLPFLRRQIEILRPKVIVLLGAVALEALVSPLARISKSRGTWMNYADTPMMPTYHPAYLLRNPKAMWDVWADMEKVLARLGRTAVPADKPV